MTIYKDILQSINKGQKLLAVLIDPDKFSLENTSSFIQKVNTSVATHIFVGGSTVEVLMTEKTVQEIKKYTKLPIVLFPGDVTQITKEANALLFLSLISGRNPEYLIGKHVLSISKLKNSNIEVIPTGYILIESGKTTAVQRVTNTRPLPRHLPQDIIDTASAGQLLGLKLIYLEAGSGAKEHLTAEIISGVKKELDVPLIVGGGIKSKKQLNVVFDAGADLVVIGTAFEKDELFFNELRQ
ncbi:geranylgeranylglyceryl/heptaprenylglyceryl phosphate synthase [Algibacter mikhailovii]|uniref:geranylgeranylglyceryl/heptaprenylglyceryl phosphate synthase n=1 Tax=Algibacter mikhailovii TaxID=425498 RepID=UPI002495698C|nr:geranylgeranylglyceryl/heptaprenylglyceryl phosphate synthase [Algibacter mikhailovii]